nr:Wadjet anti-phage system protein JetD domain-containing protein [Xylella fastidiosa]
MEHLTTEEAAVYDDLRYDRHQPRLRLEQERIGFRWVCDRLACLLSAPPQDA